MNRKTFSNSCSPFCRRQLRVSTVNGLSYLELQVVQSLLRNQGLVPVALRSFSVQQIFAEVFTASASGEFAVPAVLAYTFWGRVYLQRIPWFFRVTVRLTVSLVMLSYRGYTWLMQLIESNLNFARRFQKRMPGERLLERWASQRTLGGFLLSLLAVSLRDNVFFPTEMLHTGMVMLFHSKAWHEAEPWMTACSLPGILQMFSCFLALRSVIRMLNPADLNQARAGRLPGSVHLAIHWLHGDAWISANDLEANWRIQSLLNDLRDSGIALRSSFRPDGASVYAASLQQPGQSLWLCCGIIRMTSKDYERVKPLLAQHGQLLPEHRLVLPSQSILHIWRLAQYKNI